MCKGPVGLGAKRTRTLIGQVDVKTVGPVFERAAKIGGARWPKTVQRTGGFVGSAEAFQRPNTHHPWVVNNFVEYFSSFVDAPLTFVANIRPMKLQQLLPAAALVLFSIGLRAQCSEAPLVDKELFDLLRKQPTLSATHAETLIEVVNDRFEPCEKRKDARYVRTITPTGHGYSVKIQTPHGFTLMTGVFKDAEATVAHGDFRYYDDAGTLRSEGRYVDGQKIGVWHRYDDRGHALTDKTYDGLDWEGMQLKLGLASQCCYLEDVAAE